MDGSGGAVPSHNGRTPAGRSGPGRIYILSPGAFSQAISFGVRAVLPFSGAAFPLPGARSAADARSSLPQHLLGPSVPGLLERTRQGGIDPSEAGVSLPLGEPQYLTQ